MAGLGVRAGVTWSRKSGAEQKVLAKAWAQQLGIPLVIRDGNIAIEEILAQQNLEQLLVVTSSGPVLHTAFGRLAYHPSMAVLRILELERGGQDNLVAALGLEQGMRVFDGTLGLAADAAVCSYAVGSTGQVVGTEASPLLAFLLQQGLQHYKVKDIQAQEALRRIQVVSDLAKNYLQTQPADSFDVCYFDPMFQHPTKNSPAMDGLRPVAHHAALDEETIGEALRVAPKLVIKERGERTLAEYGCQEFYGGKYSKVKFGVIRR